MPSGLYYLNSLDWSSCNIRGVWIPIYYSNSADFDQIPHSVASNLDLHDLPVSLLWDARLKWVNVLDLNLT